MQHFLFWGSVGLLPQLRIATKCLLLNTHLSWFIHSLIFKYAFYRYRDFRCWSWLVLNVLPCCPLVFINPRTISYAIRLLTRWQLWWLSGGGLETLRLLIEVLMIIQVVHKIRIVDVESSVKSWWQFRCVWNFMFVIVLLEGDLILDTHEDIHFICFRFRFIHQFLYFFIFILRRFNKINYLAIFEYWMQMVDIPHTLDQNLVGQFLGRWK